MPLRRTSARAKVNTTPHRPYPWHGGKLKAIIEIRLSLRWISLPAERAGTPANVCRLTNVEAFLFHRFFYYYCFVVPRLQSSPHATVQLFLLSSIRSLVFVSQDKCAAQSVLFSLHPPTSFGCVACLLASTEYFILPRISLALYTSKKHSKIEGENALQRTTIGWRGRTVEEAAKMKFVELSSISKCSSQPNRKILLFVPVTAGFPVCAPV